MSPARRLASAAACAVTAIALAPGTAYAAQGTLILGRVAYQNPSGCYEAQGPLMVNNHTDESVRIYRSPHCQKPPAPTTLVHTPRVPRIPPHSSGWFAHVSSVYIP